MYNLSSLPSHEHNPYIEQIRISKGQKLTKIQNTSKKVIDTTTNQIDNDINIVLAKETNTDKTPFIKLYKGKANLIFNLSKPSLRIIGFIIDNKLEFNRDTINLSIEELNNELSYTGKSTVSNAIAELIYNQILAKSQWTDCYYINPTIFYNGERRRLFI